MLFLLVLRFPTRVCFNLEYDVLWLRLGLLLVTCCPEFSTSYMFSFLGISPLHVLPFSYFFYWLGVSVTSIDFWLIKRTICSCSDALCYCFIFFRITTNKRLNAQLFNYWLVFVIYLLENDSETARRDLLAELELLKLIEPHPNVIGLLGCCTRTG